MKAFAEATWPGLHPSNLFDGRVLAQQTPEADFAANRFAPTQSPG